MATFLTDATVSTGLTAEQTASLGESIKASGNSIMSTYVSLLPTIAVLVGISFAIYFVTKQLKGLKKGK